jgi:3-oxoacyl-[acyl-carrier-protein] synthase-1
MAARNVPPETQGRSAGRLAPPAGKAQPVFVRAIGMACPVGLRWQTACAAMRAGITRRQDTPHRDDRRRPIAGSYLASLDATWTEEQRWLHLLASALVDAARDPTCGPLAEVPIVVALPRDRRGEAFSPRWLAQELSQRVGGALEPGRIQVVTGGAAGGYDAIAAGRQLLQAGRQEACLVAAADSLIGARPLRELDRQRRLHTDDNADGVTPGEGAVCLGLSRSGDGALAVIRGIGRGREPGSPGNGLPVRGEGITTAARAALVEAGLAFADLDFRLSDAAGESHQLVEQALCLARLLRGSKERFPLWLPSRSLGDTGAAAGLSALAWAVAAFARKYAPGRRAIGFAGNDQGERAALVIESLDRHHPS